MMSPGVSVSIAYKPLCVAKKQEKCLIAETARSASEELRV